MRLGHRVLLAGQNPDASGPGGRWRTTLPEPGEVIQAIPNKKLRRRGAIGTARITVWQYVMEQLPAVRSLNL
jgi:hypothetical protein